MNRGLRIAIIEPSYMIRNGLELTLRKQSGLPISVVIIDNPETWEEAIRIHNPDILIVNPQALINFPVSHLRKEGFCPKLKIWALCSAFLPEEQLLLFDGQLSIYDSLDVIKEKFKHVLEVEGDSAEEENNEEQQSLSAREKEIVICVVKGMTNREIADRLFLSTHTVITHRRNIARKLQIHSPSGLTIYAIVNKLVELGDIKQ